MFAFAVHMQLVCEREGDGVKAALVRALLLLLVAALHSVGCFGQSAASFVSHAVL